MMYINSISAVMGLWDVLLPKVAPVGGPCALAQLMCFALEKLNFLYPTGQYICTAVIIFSLEL